MIAELEQAVAIECLKLYARSHADQNTSIAQSGIPDASIAASPAEPYCVPADASNAEQLRSSPQTPNVVGADHISSLDNAKAQVSDIEQPADGCNADIAPASSAAQPAATLAAMAEIVIRESQECGDHNNAASLCAVRYAELAKTRVDPKY